MVLVPRRRLKMLRGSISWRVMVEEKIDEKRSLAMKRLVNWAVLSKFILSSYPYRIIFRNGKGERFLIAVANTDTEITKDWSVLTELLKGLKPGQGFLSAVDDYLSSNKGLFDNKKVESVLKNFEDIGTDSDIEDEILDDVSEGVPERTTDLEPLAPRPDSLSSIVEYLKQVPKNINETTLKLQESTKLCAKLQENNADLEEQINKLQQENQKLRDYIATLKGDAVKVSDRFERHMTEMEDRHAREMKLQQTEFRRFKAESKLQMTTKKLAENKNASGTAGGEDQTKQIRAFEKLVEEMQNKGIEMAIKYSNLEERYEALKKEKSSNNGGGNAGSVPPTSDSDTEDISFDEETIVKEVRNMVTEKLKAPLSPRQPRKKRRHRRRNSIGAPAKEDTTFFSPEVSKYLNKKSFGKKTAMWQGKPRYMANTELLRLRAEKTREHLNHKHGADQIDVVKSMKRQIAALRQENRRILQENKKLKELTYSVSTGRSTLAGYTSS